MFYLSDSSGATQYQGGFRLLRSKLMIRVIKWMVTLSFFKRQGNDTLHIA